MWMKLWGEQIECLSKVITMDGGIVKIGEKLWWGAEGKIPFKKLIEG